MKETTNFKMKQIFCAIILELFVRGALSFECKCNFDDDCLMFRNVDYLNGNFLQHAWRRQDHEASGKFTYMFIPTGNAATNVEAYLRSSTPLRADGINRCLSFFYKVTRYPYARLQVQIWPGDLVDTTILFNTPNTRADAENWREATVDIPGTTVGHVVFTGRQERFPAQVFLDDVVMLEGECFKSRPYPEFPVNGRTTPGRNGITTRRPTRVTTSGPTRTTPPLLNDVFFRGGAYFSNDINSDLWENTLLNLPVGLTISTTRWSRTNIYPPELGMVMNVNPERGYFLFMTVGINILSAPAYTKAYVMTSHNYAADGQDKCLKMDYLQFQTSGNLGSIGIFMSPYFIKTDVYLFNARMERLYKYPREGTYVRNSSPYWRSLEVTVPGSKAGYIFIEGETGTGTGLIAVDNVSVFMGRCPNPDPL